MNENDKCLITFKLNERTDDDQMRFNAIHTQHIRASSPWCLLSACVCVMLMIA